jgi:hypothetical protein
MLVPPFSRITRNHLLNHLRARDGFHKLGADNWQLIIVLARFGLYSTADFSRMKENEALQSDLSYVSHCKRLAGIQPGIEKHPHYDELKETF